MRPCPPRRSTLAILAALCLAASCDDAILLEPVRPASSLVISWSTPSSGDATLTSSAQVLAENQVRLTQLIEGVTHELDVEWDAATGEVTSVEHTWTTSSQTSLPTKCPSSGCNPGEIALDVEAKTIAFTDLDLVGTILIVTPTRSTLDGTIQW
jgi:hypothetical protein